MTTTPTIPGREIVAPITVVSGACVMSRNALSDFGSDLASIGGGQLGGIEKAVESARLVAMQRLEAAARSAPTRWWASTRACKRCRIRRSW